ncbi:serpin family protein [Gorillibacterium timonense]|uniref:serpin family protein n=1 Tax=Gorillibacterium timonense TaxID=1689269 RepID=UPI00071D4748|nr:serpin family protein [Gorillibacterium timonense]
MSRKQIIGLAGVVILVLGGLVAAYMTRGEADETLHQKADKRSASSMDELTAKVADANQKTALALSLKLFEKKTTNSLFSPVSLSMALGMVYSGAAGETQAEMTKALHYKGLDPEKVAKGNKALLDTLSPSSSAPDKFQLKLANSLWLDKGISFSSHFLKKVKDGYQAEVATLDFTSSKAPDTINRWVKKQADGLIPKMIDGPLGDTKLALLNAASLKAKWENQFQPSTTFNEPFIRADGLVINVPTMHQVASFGYRKADLFSAVRMPYADSTCSMIIVLPNGPGLTALLPTLLKHPEDWTGSAFTEQLVNLTLPKFRFSDEMELTQPLTDLGMKQAFTPGKANFTPIADIQPSLAISRILQRSFIEVDEGGTKAAAATAVLMAGGAAAQPVNMTVDRPFFLAIQDEATGTLLFTGTVYDPET